VKDDDVCQNILMGSRKMNTMEYAFRNLILLLEIFLESINKYDVSQLIMLSEGAEAHTSNKLASSSRVKRMYTFLMTNVARSGENILQDTIASIA